MHSTIHENLPSVCLKIIISILYTNATCISFMDELTTTLQIDFLEQHPSLIKDLIHQVHFSVVKDKVY